MYMYIYIYIYIYMCIYIYIYTYIYIYVRGRSDTICTRASPQLAWPPSHLSNAPNGNGIGATGS